MIGKPQWFGRRKYGGWGVWPKTWQGWAYLAAVWGVFFIINSVTFAKPEYQTWTFVAVAVILGIDIIDIMIRLPRDEREKMHEAIAERNAMWAMILVLAAGLGYRTAVSIAQNNLYIDPVIIAAIATGLAVKAASNIYLERKS
ncbi:MAG: hypothetical protein Q8N81_03935 [bacterium]|nr:hypothetical protein [bacterium]